ncbi:hypothetical protein [Pinibacter soli]|uniref:Uncharacterized protein n=1 Tax=Pinibacter soli TaxID=3044211 RepID=A0ABT6RFI7_9BACT|nr:hypothetical protein [Pinibacter soli]MDI3320627.1 hypothetical protein [Pinibacter soli]
MRPLPRSLPLVLCFISSVFILKAQEQGKIVPVAKTSFSQTKNNKAGIKSNSESCICNVNPVIVPQSKQGTTWIYQGIPNASCNPFPTSFNLPNNLTARSNDTCGVSNVQYDWSIASGNNVASINGPTNGSTVSVSLTGSGTFTIRLSNTATCSDNSSCTNFTYYTDSVNEENCTCTAGPVTITPTNKQGNLWTYQGSAQASCTGQHGVSPNLQACTVQNTSYSWSILAQGGSASLSGPTNGQTVNVTINNSGSFELRLDATTTCSDGKTCTNYNFYTDSSKVDSAKHCSCDVDIDCAKVNEQGSIRTYTGVVKGGCTGEFGASPPYQPCGINNVVWSWSIAEGNNIAKIVGPANQQTVTVQITGTGSYTLRVQGDVTCSDGNQSCGSNNFDYCKDSANVDKKCGFVYTESKLPIMSGGLSAATSRHSRIRRDDFVSLIAEGKDYDKVTIECTPSYDCDSTQKKSSKDVLLVGKVRFEWEIQSGEGNFVKLGLLPENATDGDGDRIIFQPPFVPWPKQGQPPNTKTTEILLRVIDETGSGVLLDDDAYDKITIVTKRSYDAGDNYDVDITNSGYTLPKPDIQEDNNGTCSAAYSWDKPNDLKKPVIKLPAVADNNKMVLGELMVLEAENQNETDELKMVCQSSSCSNDGGKKEYPDDIQWTWKIEGDDGTKGSFVGGNTGRFVIYKAPDKMPGQQKEFSVYITVKVKNTGVQKDDVEPPPSDSLAIKIFRPGVQLEYPALDWLPKWNNTVELKSYLLYNEGGTWKPALAHMGRIHFFELLNLSHEKGNAMNWPLPGTANACQDYVFEDGDPRMEIFQRPNDPASTICDGYKHWIHTRSQKPAKEETVTVVSEDQGGYGFLRSFANINHGGADSIKGETPVYEPVPIPPEKVAHPSGRPKKTIYTDNRVTIPRDVDENKIADGGWRTQGNVLIKDPVNPRDDNDNQLVGDGFAGDGLSNYEEYRGFLVQGNYIRTNIFHKDLFINNAASFNLTNFRESLTGANGAKVDVHEIRPSEYVDNKTREINFNYNPQLHYIPVLFEPLRAQKGLWMIDAKQSDEKPGLLGQTFSADPRFTEVNTPPNWVAGIAIFTTAIKKYCTRYGINQAGKLNHVVSHELGHGISMYHHGEEPYVLQGLQSGDVGCIMRYDNIPPDNVGEAIGTIFCNQTKGTGTNALKPCVPTECYGDAAKGRGDCIHQFRISCRTILFPTR